MSRYEKSKQLFDRAVRTLAGGVSSQFRAGEVPHPLFFEKADGVYLWDADGNRYLDFTLSQGPLFLGHSHRRVVDAVCEAAEKAQIFSAQHLAELELAEKLVEYIPCAELVRFSTSGSEAVHCALRLARAYTGRRRIIKFEGHYHGWYDNIAYSINPSPATLHEVSEEYTPIIWSSGQPEKPTNLLILPWNNREALRTAFSESGPDIAGAIAEPIMCNNGCIPPAQGFLEELRELCQKHGSVLIFDEVITGFRLGLGGAQEFLGVTPDLAVFGKAMGNGFPISALVGKSEVMELIASGLVVQAGTLNANLTSVAAALATIQSLEEGSPKLYESLFEKTRSFMQRLEKLGRELGLPVLLQGPGPMFYFGFSSLDRLENYRDCLQSDTPLYESFVREMKDSGIRLIGRGLWYLSPLHTEEHFEYCLAQAAQAFDVIAGKSETSQVVRMSGS